MRPKILIVEDDGAMAGLVRKVLEDGDCESDHVRDADLAMEYLRQYSPQLVILDVNMPGMTGTRFCELLRKDPRTVDLPVLMLTSLNADKDKIQGLRSGADDYVVKPFQPQELLLRVRAILRRAKRQDGIGDKLLSVHGITVDLERHRVELRGAGVELRPKEFDILVALMERPGKVFSARALGEAVWRLDEVVTQQTIRAQIHNLRKKLGTLGALIETVEDVGYRLKEP